MYIMMFDLFLEVVVKKEKLVCSRTNEPGKSPRLLFVPEGGFQSLNLPLTCST